MNYKYEFSSISTNGEPNKDLFTEMYNGTLIKNKPFTVELEDKDVELHIYIEDIDMAEYDNCEDHIISIGVVPAFKSLSEKHQEDLLGQYDMAEDKEELKKNTTWQLQDAISYGFGIPLHTVTVTDLDKVEHTLNSAIAVHGAVESLIGFDLDKHINRIGNTGWDFLNDYCCDKDLIATALARFN